MSDEAALRDLETVPLGLPAGLELEWLGVAGYRLTYEGVSIFLDPYVSRASLWRLLLGRPALSDAALLDAYIRAPGPVAGGGLGLSLQGGFPGFPCPADTHRGQGRITLPSHSGYPSARPRRPES